MLTRYHQKHCSLFFRQHVIATRDRVSEQSRLVTSAQALRARMLRTTAGSSVCELCDCIHLLFCERTLDKPKHFDYDTSILSKAKRFVDRFI